MDQLDLMLPFPDGWVEEQTREWTPEMVLWLREYVLVDALQSALDGRCAEKTRRETREWILSDEIHPFSYRICATECGYDPERLRDVFLSVEARGRRGETFKVQDILHKEAA